MTFYELATAQQICYDYYLGYILGYGIGYEMAVSTNSLRLVRAALA